MSKGPSQPPPAPDPTEIAGAQGEANIQAAIASTLLGQTGTVGPSGTTSFAQTGGQNVGDQFIPSFTRTTTLTPEGQAQFEAQQQLGGSLTNLAQEQVGRVGGALGEGIDVSQLPALQGGARPRSLQGEIGFGQTPQTQLDLVGLPDVRQDFAEQGRELEQATFERGLGLLSPGFEREREAANLQLTERGLPLGSESAAGVLDPLAERQDAARRQLALASVGAGRAEQARLFGQQSQLRGQQFGERGQAGQFANVAQQQGFGQALAGGQFGNQAQTLAFNQAQARAAAANAARAQGFGEEAFIRSLPINDIAALLGTAPGVQQPQFQATPAFAIQAPDVIGANLGAGQLAQTAFQQQQQQSGGLLGGLFSLGGSLGSAAILSDRRLKAYIRAYGKTAKGFNLYKYIKNGVEEIGVMAQEVMQTLPEAVVVRNGGYAVLYDKVV